MRRLLTPHGAYHALRGQLGSIRNVYLARDATTRHTTDEHQEVVLLLHGFFQTRNIWDVMEDRLRYDGYGVISFRQSGLFRHFNTAPIDRIARDVAEKVDALCKRSAVRGVHIIGHSKGGLVARRFIQHYGGVSRTKSLITLGTPHHGTPTALVGIAILGAVTSNPRELLPNSPVIRALRRDTFPAQVPLTSVYSREDLVCPYFASILRPRPGESSMENVQVRGIGHSQLTWDAGVYRIVRDRLDQASALWKERRRGDAEAQGR